jgi:hypothetical protein
MKANNLHRPHPALLFLLLLAAPAFAQQPQLLWERTYYTGTGTNIGKRVVLGDADDVYSLGEDGVYNAYLVRYRSYDGQPQWQVQWDSTTHVVDLVRATNGTLYATWVHYNQPFNSPLDIGVGAWSSDGTPLWTTYWNDSLNRDDVARDMHLDPDGNLLICATTEELFGNPSVSNNISVLKLDPSGNLLWRRTWNGALNGDDEPNAITTDAAGNSYVTGYTTNPGNAGLDIVVLKYDTDGVLQWSRSINRNAGFGTHVDVGHHIRVHSSGRILVAAMTESPGAVNLADISLYALNSTGATVWSYHYNNQTEEEVLGLEEAPNGDLYLQGRFSALDGDGEVVMRVNANGGEVWTSTYATSSLDRRFPKAMALSPDGTVITTGTVGDQLLRDAYARCYDADGTALWTYRYTATNSFNEEEGHDVVVGPNRAIYVTGMNDQQATSLIRGVTFCLCPAAQGVCLLAPQARSAFPVTAMAGIDVDQDGWRDLVFDIPLQNALGVYLNGPDGFTLSFPVLLPGAPTLLATGDLDQDGDDDIVTGTFGGADLNVVVNGNGTLAYSGTIPLGDGVLDLVMADLDGQNGPDVVAVKNQAPYLYVLLNNGDGSLTTTTPTAVPNPYRVAVGDVNGDGAPDLLIGRVVNDNIHLMLGNGDGTFGAPVGHASGLTGPALVGIGDFDFDGNNDLVTCNGSTSWAVRPGLGDGTFGAAITGIAGAVDRFLISPFAEDSTLRLITGNSGATRQVRYSTCSNTYNTTDLWTTAPGNHLVDVADWSNDGSPDLLSFHTQGDIRIWRNCDTLGVVTRVPTRALPQEAFAVVPNPTTGRFAVDVKAATELSIHNAQGQLVWRQRIASGTNVIEAPLAKGVHVVRLQGIASAQRVMVE